MDIIDVQTLNDQYGISDQLTFIEGPGGMPIAKIVNQHAKASVSLYGGHVLNYQPIGEKPLFFISKYSYNEQGKPIRGGIPLCWPWFSTHPTDKNKPLHGFVRTDFWKVLGTTSFAGDVIQIRLGMNDTDSSRVIWPHAFQVQIIVTVGKELLVELVVHNTGTSDFSFTEAMHPYFLISDIAQIEVQGLDGISYIDRIDGDTQKRQSGSVVFQGETDRIYLTSHVECSIIDKGWNRRILLTKSGSAAIVVWNPWIEKSKKMQDFGADEYHSMVCVEPANAGGESIILPSSGRHTMTMTIGVSHLPEK